MDKECPICIGKPICRACHEVLKVKNTPRKKLPLLIGILRTARGKDLLSERLKP